MTEHPKVFISYSHDSPDHRRWVSELGAKLRHNGIDAILDQWDLGPGDDVTQFMERGIIESDRVLVVCTDQYVRKANAAEGGVGYERMIVTAQLVQDLGTNKFIPIIRQTSGREQTPTFLGTRVYIDFRNDNQFDEEFDKLIHELHQVPVVEKPPLGENPFAQLSSGQETLPSEGTDTQLPEIPEQLASASVAYEAAVEITRAEDEVGWRQLLKQIKPRVFDALIQWRQNELAGKPLEGQTQFKTVDTAVEIISPLISVDLVGVESGRVQFRNQKYTFYDLLNLSEWSSDRHTVWANIPSALGYVYHSLHGSLCLSTNQLGLALSFAQVKIPFGGVRHRHVWETRAFMGWSKLFGPNCKEGWKYLAKAYDWEWLTPIFNSELEYQTSLVAYYMALHIHELAAVIASGRQNTLNANSNPRSSYGFNVPLTFFSQSPDINEHAVSLLLRNPEALMKLWTSVNVTREQMKNSWENWICLYEDWIWNVYQSSFDARIHLPQHFKDLFSH